VAAVLQPSKHRHGCLVSAEQVDVRWPAPFEWPDRDRVGAAVKDRYGEPERGGVNGSRYKFFSKEMKTPTRRTRLPTHVSDSLPRLVKAT
jgi:hypothetical protein